MRRVHRGSSGPFNAWHCPGFRIETGLESAFRRLAPSIEARVVHIMRRGIRADGIVIVAHVDENMRMVEGRQSADAHEFLGADRHLWNARLIVEMRRAMGGHDLSKSRKEYRSQHKPLCGVWVAPGRQSRGGPAP